MRSMRLIALFAFMAACGSSTDALAAQTCVMISRSSICHIGQEIVETQPATGLGKIRMSIGTICMLPGTGQPDLSCPVGCPGVKIYNVVANEPPWQVLVCY